MGAYAAPANGTRRLTRPDGKGPRAQIDRALYKKHMREELQSYPNLSIILDSVADVIVAVASIDPVMGGVDR